MHFPQLVEQPEKPGLLQVIKGAVGKDFSQPIPMPVEISEPTSDMMKRAEEIEFSELLDQVSAAMSYRYARPRGQF